MAQETKVGEKEPLEDHHEDHQVRLIRDLVAASNCWEILNVIRYTILICKYKTYIYIYNVILVITIYNHPGDYLEENHKP